MDSNNQRLYFDKQEHRYRSDHLNDPPIRSRVEYQQMEKSLTLPVGSKLMDFGSGNGRVALYFLRRGFHIHAVDISTASLRELTRTYKQQKKASWGVLTTSTRIPNRRKYDGIVGADILHHVDLLAVLPKLQKAVKRNGVFVFSEPNGWNPLWYVYIVLKKLPWNIEKNILRSNRVYLPKLFTDIGYKNIQVRSLYIFPLSLQTPFSYRIIIRGNVGEG